MSTSRIIMIIDDDPDDIELFCDSVREIDGEITCISSTNCEEALFKLNNPANILPDYIFLDLNMPRLNGKECLRKLKANHMLQGIPVIIYTTSKLKADMEETKFLGAASFLTKPNKMSDLRNAIGAILQGKYDAVR